jgi:cystathionine beta-lyase
VPSFDVDAISLTDLRQRQSAKYQAYDPDVIPAWVAEMDFPLAPPIARALHDAIDRSDTGYRSGKGMAEALIDFAARRWNWTIESDQIVVVPDVLAGLVQTLEWLTEPGSSVVLNTPIYPPFFSAVKHVAHRGIVDVPLNRSSEGAYSWDLVAMEEAFARPEVSAFLLCSPHNPTGSVPSRDVLETIQALAVEHDVLVISDEIHGPLTLPGATHVPYLSVAAGDAQAVTLTAASKAWNLPGLKCAQIVGSGRTGPVLQRRVPLEVIYGTGHLGIIAGVAAYRDGGPWLDEVVGILDGNRRLVAKLLTEFLPLAGYVPPDASYLAWIDFREYDAGDDPSARFLEEARVALSPGPTFGAQGVGFARLNFATSPAILREIVGRLGGVFQ